MIKMAQISRYLSWETMAISLSNLDETAVLLTTLTTSALIFLYFLNNIYNFVARDYKAFVSLGPGGTPSTPYGYVWIKFLSIFALKDPYKPALVPVHFKQQTGFLTTLPKRVGERPIVRGIAPHRQTNQKVSPIMFKALRTAIVNLSDSYPDVLRQGTSCLEKHGPGLFAIDARHLTPHCNGEVCHAHPSEGSMHLTLHPADAATVLRAGWGERHPLGSGGWLQNFVPAGFIMVYAPRNEAEVRIVMQIVHAAVWWVGGVRLDAINAGKRAQNRAVEVGDGAEREMETVGKEWIASCPDPKQSLMV